MTEATFRRFLDVLEHDLLPLTRQSVALGNKVFGAAVLKKSDLSLVALGTNEETENPLWHGEISCLNRFWALPERPDPQACLFLSSHEPCSLCLSAITWSGFDNFSYLFSYEDSRDAFNIPHDLKILQEVFACDNGAYRKHNAFWTSYNLPELIAQAGQESLLGRIAALRAAYSRLSDVYQARKDAQDIPLG